MPESIASLLSEYRDGIQRLRAAATGLTPDQLRARPVEGKWSILEVVAHLADSEQAWCHRMKRAIAEDRPLLIGYDESRFTATLGYHQRDIERELTLFDLQRTQMAEILESLPPEAWDRPAIHSESGRMTLREMVRIETDHVFGHLVHVNAKRAALQVPLRD